METLAMQSRSFFAWAAAFVVIAFCAWAGVQWFNNNLNTHFIASKCEHRVEQGVDPGNLQSWATNMLALYSVGHTNYMGPFDAPTGLNAIWRRSPPSVYIKGGYGGEAPYVFIFWGAAAGHWGLSIGRTNFVPAISAYGGRMWKPGIYFWEQF